MGEGEGRGGREAVITIQWLAPHESWTASRMMGMGEGETPGAGGGRRGSGGGGGGGGRGGGGGKRKKRRGRRGGGGKWRGEEVVGKKEGGRGGGRGAGRITEEVMSPNT